jgi:hypothetical protein
MAARLWGAARTIAMSTVVMNRHSDCAARDLKVREALSTLLLIDTATNNRPVRAPK